MEKLIAGLMVAVLVFFMLLFFSFLFAIVTKIAWAFSVAEIFHLQDLTFWQAFWLNVFGGMVFKGSSSSVSKS